MPNTYFVSSTERDKYFGCIMTQKMLFKKSKTPYILEIHKNDLAITPFELHRFKRSLTSWGFPLTITKRGDYFNASFEPKDYTGANHFCAAFTMLRYVLKEGVVTNYNTSEVVPTMFALKRKYKHLDLWQCFQLAQYKKMPGQHCHNHSCFKIISKIVPLEDLKQKIIDDASVNDFFYKEGIPGYKATEYWSSIKEKGWRDMHKLINANEEEALKILL